MVSAMVLALTPNQLALLSPRERLGTFKGLCAGLQVRLQPPPSNFIKIEKLGWSAIVEADLVMAATGNSFMLDYLDVCHGPSFYVG